MTWIWNYHRICVEGKWILEHRHNMEIKLGRKLLLNELVHHKDGNPRNNVIENLELETRASHNNIHHPKERITLTCTMCQKLFDRKRAQVKYKVKNNTLQFCSRSCIGKYIASVRPYRPIRQKIDGKYICSQCKQHKFPEEFYRRNDSRTGIKTSCKDCDNEYKRTHKQTRKIK